MIPIRRLAAAALTLAFAASPAFAQGDSDSSSSPSPQAVSDRLDGMNEQVQTLQSDMDKLKKFKFSGYVQARWETAENKNDSVRVTSSAITPANNERFYIRRGRLKLTYDAAPLSQAVVYLDGASSGSSINVRLLEAYVTLYDPWTVFHQHAGTIGQFNVPFGYEIERSSSLRELPERSRAENVLFPGERDRGIKLVSQWTPQLETVLAVLNGGGINDVNFPTADPTRAKDLLGRIRFSQGTVDVCVSYLDGAAVTPLTGPDVVTDRRRFGADAQLYYQVPSVGGGTLRGEFYDGHDINPDNVRARTVAAGGSPGGTLIIPGANPDDFATDVRGWYVMAVQNVGEVLQAAVRYDTYDPNLDLAHDQYERWSAGVNYFYDAYVRLTLSYDAVSTERLTSGSYTDPDDNLWTFQAQLKF